MYRSTADVYKQYRALSAKAKKAFRNKHYNTLNAHDQAYRFLSTNGHADKLPSVHALKTYKKEQVIPARDKYRENYDAARTEIRKISKIRENIYPLLDKESMRHTKKSIDQGHSR